MMKNFSNLAITLAISLTSACAVTSAGEDGNPEAETSAESTEEGLLILSPDLKMNLSGLNWQNGGDQKSCNHLGLGADQTLWATIKNVGNLSCGSFGPSKITVSGVGITGIPATFNVNVQSLSSTIPIGGSVTFTATPNGNVCDGQWALQKGTVKVSVAKCGNETLADQANNTAILSAGVPSNPQ